MKEVGVRDSGDDAGLLNRRARALDQIVDVVPGRSSPYQSFRSSWPEAAYIAVTSSNASSGLPPVLTFSNTTQTASFDVDRSSAITGTR